MYDYHSDVLCILITTVKALPYHLKYQNQLALYNVTKIVIIYKHMVSYQKLTCQKIANIVDINEMLWTKTLKGARKEVHCFYYCSFHMTKPFVAIQKAFSNMEQPVIGLLYLKHTIECYYTLRIFKLLFWLFFHFKKQPSHSKLLFTLFSFVRFSGIKY